MNKGKVFHVTTEEEFQQLVDNSKNHNVKVFLKFGAQWCGPCKKIQPLYEKLAETYTNCVFACLNVEELEDVCESFNVSSLPTFSILIGGQYYELFKGANESKLVQIVQNQNKSQ